ncbi:LysM peptidoglycan-binding domain-containing protein [Kaistia adipata]|uniref:LysM peptidoglycan-binding domain-containing protein n=1 Tax=Kaistia adipata TaxID=166954 RepID=UPI00040A7D40|nr:LysM peptidoglycan-binding domain-containing protein [Kaistia adipata]
MAEQTPPGPKTSGRVAGIVAVAAILVGGYYGLIAKPTAEKTRTPEQEASAPPADAKAPAANAEKAPEPAKAAEAGKTSEGEGAAAKSGAGTEQKAEVPAEGAVPSFDIVRVEPTGETVVAGLAAPKSKVELLDGSSTVATAEANERGEWAVAIEKPLAPGTHDLSIRTTSPDKKVETLSEQSVAVQVQEPGKGEALVVLNTPDSASKVLQKPVASAEQQVASATQQPSASEPPKAGSNGDASAAGTAPAAEAPAAAAAQPDASQPAGSATVDAAAPKAGEAPQQQADAGPAAGEPAAGATEKTIAAPEGKDGASATADASKAAAEPKVTVDAVEVEDGKLFVAGSAKSKAPVRVYMDDKLVGEAKPEENGRWLLETKRTVEPGRRIVRADQVEADGSGKVVERAEVPFERTEDVAMLAPVVATGGGGSGASADGNVPAPQSVIIRRGDNLWTISRRLYGRGIRYSTIYEANHDQIRSPHLIYPGQTFVLPAGDANWTN